MPVQQKGSHSPHCFIEKEGNGIESSNQLWMVEEKSVVRVVVGWGAQGVCLGFRVCGFGFYHFLTVYLEGEQKPSLLCGPFHSGFLSDELYSHTIQDGWGLSLWQCHMSLRLSLGQCLMDRAWIRSSIKFFLALLTLT